MGGVWYAALGDGRSESGLQLHLLSESRVRTDVLPRGTPSSHMRPWEASGMRGLGAAGVIRATSSPPPPRRTPLSVGPGSSGCRPHHPPSLAPTPSAGPTTPAP